MVRFSSFAITHEPRISRMYFETQMAGEFSMSQILPKLGVKWPLVKAFNCTRSQLDLRWSDFRVKSFVIIHESRISGIYFESQMAGEFSMSQILLKLGVKWP